MPATEGERGGKQIGSMLRLLTSDLVLDEPDDFDLADLPALCRLVNWAGMLGARVLVSSATLPPSLIDALFDAYLAGRRLFQEAWGDPGKAVNVCCAWFDEYHVDQSDHSGLSCFSEAHRKFVEKRIPRLQKAIPRRLGRLLQVNAEGSTPEEAAIAISRAIHGAQYKLHEIHGQVHPETGKTVSFGLVRMANINPLVAVARELIIGNSLADEAPGNHRVHYCVYHGRHPLAVRSAMERKLDKVLSRHDPDEIWHHPEIKRALKSRPEDHHIFVVLATAVAEVGRDHDYDWAIVEPSSVRSIIQLAGRIVRHRDQFPETPNVLVLSQNYKALRGEIIAFNQPGFESKQFRLNSHDLNDLLDDEQLNIINAIPRIRVRNSGAADMNLADLEHSHLEGRLFGKGYAAGMAYASLWWEKDAHWSFELQRRTPFRLSAPDVEYVLFFDEEGDTPLFHKVGDRGEMVRSDRNFERVELRGASGVSLWGADDPAEIITELAVSMDMPIGDACRRFGGLRLRERSWLYHPVLGVHGAPG